MHKQNMCIMCQEFPAALSLGLCMYVHSECSSFSKTLCMAVVTECRTGDCTPGVDASPRPIDIQHRSRQYLHRGHEHRHGYGTAYNVTAQLYDTNTCTFARLRAHMHKFQVIYILYVRIPRTGCAGVCEFGLVGVLTGPLVAALLFTLLDIYKEYVKQPLQHY